MSDAPLWLVEPDHPSLLSPAAARINEPDRPDRLTWNTFRTLAEWNTDVWIPALLEEALGADNPLSGLEWADATVELWRTEPVADDATPVVIEGREGTVLIEATLADEVTPEGLFSGARRALDLAAADRQAGYVVVTSVSGEEGDERVADLVVADLSDFDLGDTHGLRPDAIARISGWLTWRDLGTLALDLAEEADPLRSEQVHRLATELQEAFPGIEL